MTDAAIALTKTKPRPRRQWAPYLLILPSLLYLAVFFAWPMTRAIRLAVWDETALLTLRQEAAAGSAAAGVLPQGAAVSLLDRRSNLAAEADLSGASLTETWFFVQGLDPGGNAVAGWAPESRIRVRTTDAAGAAIGGTVRPKLGAGADPLTSLYSEPNEGSAIAGKLEGSAAVSIGEQAVLEVWFLIEGEGEGERISGWAPSRVLQVYGDGVSGRIDRGDTGQLTRAYIQRMLNDRFFRPAFYTTLLLIVLIIPVQFALAIIMALVIQARLKFNTLFLAIFAIPLAASDLAVGILWYAIFTQSGYLNSILQALGLIAAPNAFLTADTRYWILIAIWLAEVWRATSIVMVIVVSGLQAISQEVLEAAEVFGATLWQRLRHVILPLLKPSLQVALILRTILALQVFAVVIALSGGDVVTVLANETYRQYYTLRNMNVAAAYAGFILLISMFSAIIYLRMVRSSEEASA
ncbi:MAG: sugar ABC transporter permease [Caldilineales bacterium]|nr:sugar ABC transporter permease [Caldilineales bacterium]